MKIIVGLVFLLYAGSLPFAWHIRVWKYPIWEYIRAYRTGRERWLVDWKRDCDAAGGIHMVTKTKRRAMADDIDYNLHLSNRSVLLLVSEERR